MLILTTPNQPATDLLHTSLLHPCDFSLAVIKLIRSGGEQRLLEITFSNILWLRGYKLYSILLYQSFYTGSMENGWFVKNQFDAIIFRFKRFYLNTNNDKSMQFLYSWAHRKLHHFNVDHFCKHTFEAIVKNVH